MFVQFGFYALSVVAFGMVMILLKFADNSKQLITRYVWGGLVWLVYLVIISRTGVLDDFGFPPRIPLLVVIPAIVAGIVFTSRASFRSALEKAPLSLPVFLTSFRILVELLIYGAYRLDVFPQRVTFEGLNYDVVVGLSALPVGYLVLRQKLSLRGLLMWNVLSLLVLSFTVYAFASTYYFSDYVAETGNTQFVRFPYLLLAAVLLPAAVFLHVFSIRQVVGRQRNKEDR